MPSVSIRSLVLFLLFAVAAPTALSHDIFANRNTVADFQYLASIAVRNDKYNQEDKFRQLDEILPTPNEFRTASGAPGLGYWQQKVDYKIDVELDEANNKIIGSEDITYHNNSPDTLRYLWVQLDPNLFTPDAPGQMSETAPGLSGMSYLGMNRLLKQREFDGGVNLHYVNDKSGKPLSYTVVQTMMRIDLPRPLKTGASFEFSIGWDYAINNSKYHPGRTGYEGFDDDNNIYAIAQWYPRLAAYTDYSGWQHKQFFGRGEFTLEFGDFEVNITAPDDHVVASTGVLQNPRDVLTPQQRERLEEAEGAETPVFIITPDEAEANEDSTPEGTKTWRFTADNVRDFAFASSRKFIWDAVGHRVGDNDVMVMSYYPNEGEPLWSQYSTHASVHTLDVYSKFCFDYPYPTAISVHGVVGGGMEYPMICFNGPRPEDDGTYKESTKIGLISVVIHEIGHNYIPMIINPDERQWTWMDEGLNSFLQYLTEQEWEKDYPSWWGEPEKITGYMASRNQVPIMTNSESILQFGNNAYAKPATALNILRETILGRELFDHAFREFCRRWMFKRPAPADLFRTLEDASGIDLDWFWYGWFYTTDHCDIAVDGVRHYTMDKGDPYIDKQKSREERDSKPGNIADIRNETLPTRLERFPELRDFYSDYDELDVTDDDLESFNKLVESLDEDEKALLETDYNFYVVDFSNVGGLVMPIILKAYYEDSESETIRIPAEIWRRNNQNVSKLIITDKTLEKVELDPFLETADVNRQNNFFPQRIDESRFKLNKPGESGNPMRKALKAEEEKAAEEKADDATEESAESDADGADDN